MMDLLIYLIITLTSVFIGLFLGKNLVKLKFKSKHAALNERNNFLNQSLNDANDDLKSTQLEKEDLIASKTRLATELKNSEQRIAKNKEELNTIQEKFTKEFENLANKILEEKSTKFTEQNKLNITSILNPLKEKIEGFEKKVSEQIQEELDKADLSDHFGMYIMKLDGHVLGLFFQGVRPCVLSLKLCLHLPE